MGSIRLRRCGPHNRGWGRHSGWIGQAPIQPMLGSYNLGALHLANRCWMGARPIRPRWAAPAPRGPHRSGWLGPAGPPDVAPVKATDASRGTEGAMSLCHKHSTHWIFLTQDERKKWYSYKRLETE